MTWYRPLQRQDGRWDYTCTNSGGTYPLGYCAGYRELTNEGALRGMFDQSTLDRENARMAPFREKYHRNGHETADESERCYRLHQLDQHLAWDDGLLAQEQKRCEICQSWTGSFAYIHGGVSRSWYLCGDHLQRESVEKLWLDVKEIE